MRSPFLLFSLFTLISLVTVTATGNRIGTIRVQSHVPSHIYPGLTSVTHLRDHTILDILQNPSLVTDSTNITSTFNITATHAKHIKHVEHILSTSVANESYTLWLPDDEALKEAKSRWEHYLKEKNFTDVDVNKTWTMTETNSTIRDQVMAWTHAGIQWSIVKGNISLFDLSHENLLHTTLNDTKFVLLGKNQTTGQNETQKMRVVKGPGLLVYGCNRTMTHANRTDVMIVSGSGLHDYQIAHVYREIIAKNGRIYILDRAVDFPFNSTADLKRENATLFLRGIAKSNLNDTINNTPNITLLVPSNAAIERTIREYDVREELKKKWTPEQMKRIVKPYIVNGAYYIQDLNVTSPPSLSAISGHTHTLTRSPTGELLINGNVSVIQPNILTRNGVIHVINDTFHAIESDIIKNLPKSINSRMRGVQPLF